MKTFLNGESEGFVNGKVQLEESEDNGANACKLLRTDVVRKATEF